MECNSTTLKGCSNGACHHLNHEAVCVCNEGRVLKNLFMLNEANSLGKESFVALAGCELWLILVGWYKPTTILITKFVPFSEVLSVRKFTLKFF